MNRHSAAPNQLGEKLKQFEKRTDRRMRKLNSFSNRSFFSGSDNYEVTHLLKRMQEFVAVPSRLWGAAQKIQTQPVWKGTGFELQPKGCVLIVPASLEQAMKLFDESIQLLLLFLREVTHQGNQPIGAGGHVFLQSLLPCFGQADINFALVTGIDLTGYECVLT